MAGGESVDVGGLPLTPYAGLESRACTPENPTGTRGAGGQTGGGRKGSPSLSPFRAGQTVTLADVDGPGCIRHIWITTPPGNPVQDRGVIVRAWWDGQDTPSVTVPLTDFFGVAHGRRKPFASALVSMPEGRGLDAYFAMPFRRHARLALENASGQDIEHLFYQVDYTVGDRLDDDCGYFHAHYRRENPTALCRDYVLLDGVRGRGRFLGCVVGVRTLDTEWWGEGEFKFYLDGDTEFPTICGTGAEDYAGSAWGLGEHITPYHGCPLYEPAGADGTNAHISFYRWHILDPIYFHTDLRVTWQQIGGAFVAQVRDRLAAGRMQTPAPVQAGQAFTLFERSDDVCSTAFWYQTLP